MSKRRLRIAAAALALAATFSLSACGTNFNAATNNSYQAGVGANVRDGEIQVYNALFVDNGDGTATFSGAVSAPEGEDIIEATVEGQKVTFTGPIHLEPETLVTLGPGGEIITSLDDNSIGHNLTLTLVGNNGGKLKVSAVVVDRSDIYSSVATKAPSANAPTPAPAE